MIEVTERTVEELPAIRLTSLEAQIVECIAERLGLSPSDAMRFYFSSKMAGEIEQNLYGMQYLDAKYLADAIIEAVK